MLWKYILRILLLSWTLMQLICKVQTKIEVKFNFLNCAPIESEFFKFDNCGIKLIGRNIYAAKINATVKRNITDFWAHVRFMKKQNGWHPFLYDINFDMCDFLRNPTKYPIFKLGYNELKNYTNVKHKCPYQEGELLYLDFKVPSMDRTAYLLKLLPIDIGEYGAFFEISVNKKYINSINISGSYSDYSKLY